MAKKAQKRTRSPDIAAQDVAGDPIEGDQQLAYFVHQFNWSADTSRDARRQAEIYRDYFDNKQWSSVEEEKLKARGQPCVTDNKIKDKLEYLWGLERKTRTDPKAQPRTPEDELGADGVTSALRYVAECNHFAQVKSKVFENMTIEGFGGCEVIVDNKTYAKTTNKKILQRYIRWDRLYYDGHSLSPDFTDSRYQGIVKWMDLDEAKVTYPQMAEAFDLFTSQSFTQPTETYDDRPRWFDRGRKRVQILEHYYKTGSTWNRVVFTRVGVLEGPEKSVYIDCETGEPECPLILQSLYVDREGNRYGVVKRYKDLQDEINKRRSKSLHLLSVNQALAEKGAVEDKEAARKELARPDGYVEYTPGMKFEVRENADLAEGQFKLLQEATLALSTTGPNEALLGQTANVSGRKTQLDQQGGAIQLGKQDDAIRFWQKRVMMATFSRMKQFWTAEQYIRITEGEKVQFTPLNSSYPPDHPHVKGGRVEAGSAMNALPELEMDINIDEAPEVATIQQEDFQTLASLAGDAKVPIPPQALISCSSLSSAKKKEVLDAMSGKLPDGTEIPPQVQQMLQQKEQQIQQITQAQQAKAQEQMQTEQELQQAKADALLQQTKAQASMDKINAAQAAMEATFAARQQELEAQMTTIKAQIATMNAKEIELKALQLLADQKLTQTQDAANAIVEGAQKEATITSLTSKLETQQSEHKKQVSDLAMQHNEQLHGERETARAAQAKQHEAAAKATTDKASQASKPRKITVERDSAGRVSGATVN